MIKKPDRILLKNADLVDTVEGRLQKRIDILIEGSNIRDIGQIDTSDLTSVKEIDCSRKTVLPGLSDCHVHLAILTNQPGEVKKEILSECGVDGSYEADLEELILRAFVEHGTTQVRDCGGPVDLLRDMKARIDGGRWRGPDIFCAGPMLEKSPLTGAGNNKRWPGFTVPVDTETDAEKTIDELAAKGVSHIKTFARFDRHVLQYLIALAKKKNLPVTFDPGPTFFPEIGVDDAIDLGVNCIEHGKSLWYPALKDKIKAEHDNLVGADATARQKFIGRLMEMSVDSIDLSRLTLLAEKMKSTSTFFCPTLQVFKDYIDRPEVYRDDEHEKYRRIFEALYDVSRFITADLIRKGVTVLVGQDGWNPRFTAEEMVLLDEIGLAPIENIRAATINPALWLNIDDRYGSLQPGGKSNLVILKGNPLEEIAEVKNVYATLKNGDIFYSEN